MDAPYDAIAEWYDTYVGGPIYEELVVPNVLDLAGDVAGRHIVDVACGQGMIAREVAKRGAAVTGVDISRRLLGIAEHYEQIVPLGITYLREDAESLTSLSALSFDGAICNLALMDIADITATFCAIRRVLREDGWLIITITHPCFEVSRGRWTTRSDGTAVREVTGYFDEGYWRSDNPHGVRGQVGAYHRTLSTYLNALVDAAFRLERILEPKAMGKRAEQVPGNREVPSIMLIRARAGA
jgi:ubiquinone/menaquinone biosynthesis C-methylase UbiE